MNEGKRKVRMAISLILVALYVVGLVCMFTNSFRTGLILWVVSTLGGIGLLYWIRTMDQRTEDARKREQDAAKGDESE